jgi:hypothetical protein
VILFVQLKNKEIGASAEINEMLVLQLLAVAEYSENPVWGNK